MADVGVTSPKTNAPTGGEYKLEALLASRLGQGLALTVHWTVIHYQTPALRAARNEPDAGAPVDGGSSISKNKCTPSGAFVFGGATRNRTGDEGFADPCLTAWLWRHMERETGLEPATSALARLRSTK